MDYIPHQYQQYCIDYILNHPVCALFLDMGLGKTVITLTAIKKLILNNEVQKTLVIAPLRVARDTWPNEIKKWNHLSDIEVSVIVGNRKERESALEKNAQLYIINRENVKWLVEHYKSNKITWDYDCVVIDELSSFKNPQAKRFQFLRKVRAKAKRWIGLTGTPSSKSIADLWAEIYMLDGGKHLGRNYNAFTYKYFTLIPFYTYSGVINNLVLKRGAEQQIYKQISDMTISMKAIDHLNMPECVYVNHHVKLSKKERQLYKNLKNDFVIQLKGGKIDGKNAAVISQKLLQMSNGAVYNSTGQAIEVHKHKLEMLQDLIEAANGQSVLIAYWYQHDKDRIIEYLSSIGYNPRPILNSRDFEDWNAGNIPVAMIHPASAGHGLNLQDGGQIIIWFGLTWSLELYQQTNARLWRQGQKNTVTIHHIICQDTVDEDVMAALAEKDATQSRLINAVKARI